MVNVKGAATTYGKITRDAAAKARAFRQQGGGAGQEMGFGEKLNGFGGWFHGNLQEDAMKNGRSVLGQMGSSAIRGAGWGAVGGGTISALQGGSFWDGAKQGAFNGAVGWTAYRTAMRGTGAKSMNLFKGNNQGALSSANTMWRTMNNNGDISKQAISILNNRQGAGLARNFMNQGSKV